MKKIIKISALAALVTSSLVGADIDAKLSEMEGKIKALETQLQASSKTLAEVKAHDGNDNLKFGVDFRTAFDSIHYTHVSGTETSNPDLLTNRLWLNMGYSPDANTIFKGTLSYMKAYGDTANHSQSNSAMGVGYADFDWVTNENATDNTLKVKEAYWLYMNDTFLGNNVPWTMSIGRRPSTDGLGINLREGQKEKSPLAHTVNVEFDGLSSKFDLDKVTGVKGMSWKLCTGRGLTNAKPRFNMNGDDYAKDDTYGHDVNMYGFIFVPYDNGQYSVSTNWARAENLIGFDQTSMNTFGAVAMGYTPASVQTYMSTGSGLVTIKPEEKLGYQMGYAPQFKSFGDMDLATVMFKAEGVGEGISDYLDNTKIFASWAQSKTRPKGSFSSTDMTGTHTGGMLGSPDSQTGSSIWIGANMPCLLTADGRIGVEWNKGSKYWRSVTYGEDTLAGSKIAARGTAVEVYYTKP
ncbi:MAG: DUF3373 family protein, partial [Arcobacter sp.]|nr:DUF3373 family protein [Arcobacter sp.]